MGGVISCKQTGRKSRSFRKTIMMTAAIACLLGSEATAQEKTTQSVLIDFSIPGGSLSQAIAVFGTKSDIQIFYPAELVKGKSFNGLTGKMTGQEALERILSGTGLEYRFLDDKSVTIVEKQPAKTGEADKVELKPIVVTGSRNPATGISLNDEEIQTKFGGDLDAAIRSQAGVFTKSTDEQKGLIVNVRGMQGPGRVNSMIDGVPQNFRNVSGHSGTHDPLVYVDPIMLAGIDITKGAVKGADGLGVLSGAANFRTLESADIIPDGQQWGVLAKSVWGTNGEDYSNLVAGAAEYDVEGLAKGSVLAAFSFSQTDAYEDGRGQEIPGDDLAYSASRAGDIDPQDRPTTGLMKFEISPGDAHQLEIGGMTHSKSFFAQYADYEWDIRNRSSYARYNFNPDSEFWNVKSRAYLADTRVKFPEVGGGVAAGREGETTSYGIDVNNTSRFSLPHGLNVSWNYGGAYMYEKFEANDARGSNPEGDLKKYGLFSDVTFNYGDWDFNLGLRYDGWRTSGITEYTPAGSGSCPPGGSNCPETEEVRSGNDLNPMVSLTYRPYKGVEMFGRYAFTTRAPSTSEMFYAYHDFSGTGNTASNNLDLVAEEQRGLDIGLKLNGQDLFRKGDQGRFSIGYFNNAIDNYIGQGVDTMTAEEFAAAAAAAQLLPVPARFIELARLQAIANGEALQYQNASELVRMQGVEIEGGYDIGWAYANAAYTWSKTAQPKGIWTGIGNSTGILPEHIATLDMGTRWLNEELVIGGRVRFVGRSEQPIGAQLSGGAIGNYQLNSYTLFDLYGSYKPTENFEVFASIHNLFDRYYLPAQSGPEQIESGAGGRGRTFKLGATVRF